MQNGKMEESLTVVTILVGGSTTALYSMPLSQVRVWSGTATLG